MNLGLALIGGIGTLGLMASCLSLFACWCTYVIQVSIQRTLTPKIGVKGKRAVVYSVIGFIFFALYACLYVASRQIWHF